MFGALGVCPDLPLSEGPRTPESGSARASALLSVGAMHPSRKLLSLLVAPALALSVSAPTDAAEPTPATAAPDAPRLALTPPTGALPVSSRTTELVDHSRLDPWLPETGPRRLVTTTFYPAHRSGPDATYLSPRESTAFLDAQGDAVPPEVDRTLLSRVDVGAGTGARPLHRRGGRPLVVLSPGFGFPRATLTGLATDLASRGYVVVSVDHVHESAGTELADGSLASCAACDTDDYAGVPRGRARDLSFVLDRMLRPAVVRRLDLDPRRVALVGHSIGGNSAVSTLAADRRVDAAINLDGTFFDPVTAPIRKPVLLMGSRKGHTPDSTDTTWPQAWSHLRGPRRWVTVRAAQHDAFTDLPLIADQSGLAPEAALPGARSLRITRAYVVSFLDRYLRGGRGKLLDGPSARFPEVAFHDPAAPHKGATSSPTGSPGPGVTGRADDEVGR